jgi:dTDP-L-rhamnose 4-epimerase
LQTSVKILITGGLGFIGLHVAEALVRAGMSVVLMDNLSVQVHGALPTCNSEVLGNSRVTVIRGDVRARQDWLHALQGVRCVVHLAAETGTAQSMYQIDQYTSVNVGSTAMLFDILANESHSVEKVILASSRSVYGEGAYDCQKCGRVYPTTRLESDLRESKWDPRCPKCRATLISVPTPEDAAIRPASIYAATKFAQEELTRIAGVALGIPTVILRFQNVYGEGQSLKNPYTGILSIFSNRIRQNKPIHLFEDGQESRDLVHVIDVAAAVWAAVYKSAADGTVLNVGSGEKTTVEQIARALKKRFGDTTEPIVSGQYRVGDIRHCYSDLSKTRVALEFEPAVELEAGLDRFVSWVKKQPIERDGLDSANQFLEKRGLMSQATSC